ncbi:MAG TPA: hypothetical protein VNZ53_45745 [Steroidobacteraceae bacterium]|nr:hypothetical protein [Steroidobacteraceae bacterium]
MGEKLVESDSDSLSSLFRKTVKSSSEVPRCPILFLYCGLDAEGRIVGRAENVRDVIKSAGAYIAVIASENPGAAYVKGLGRRRDWNANIVMVLDRRGDKFVIFCRKLFEGMFAGQSMLMTWVKLAPQAQGQWQEEAPGTIMAAEAGHITFARGSEATAADQVHR